MSALQASLLYRTSLSSLSLFSTPKPSSSIQATRRLSSAAFRSHRRLALFKPGAVLPQENDKDPILDAEMSTDEVPAVTTAADDEASEGSGSSANVEKKKESRLPLMALLIGVLESVKRGFYRLAMSEWLSWWPFWRQEKRLEMLMAEADANPKDAAKQSALLAELNKHSLKKRKSSPPLLQTSARPGNHHRLCFRPPPAQATKSSLRSFNIPQQSLSPSTRFRPPPAQVRKSALRPSTRFNNLDEADCFTHGGKKLKRKKT